MTRGIMRKYYDLTQAQRRILLNELLYQGTAVNNLPALYWFDKPYAAETLIKALELLITNVDSLRFRITQQGEEYCQYIAADLPRKFAIVGHVDTHFREVVRARACMPFDFLDSDLFEFVLLRAPDGMISGIFLKIHHIIADGWCIQLLSDMLRDAYEGLEAGVCAAAVSETIRERNGSYLDYLKSEQAYLKSVDYAEHKGWWLEKFATVPEPVTLGLHPYTGKSISTRRMEFVVADTLYKQMKEFCRARHITLYQLVLNAAAVYVSRISGSDKALITTVHHGRMTKAERSATGMFVSTIPLNINCPGELSFAGLLEQERGELHEIFRTYMRFPYNKLIEELLAKKKASGDLATFNVVQLTPSRNAWRSEWLGVDCDPSPLTLYIDPNANERFGYLELAFDYQTANFSEAEISLLFERLSALLEAAILRPEAKLCELPVMSRREYELVRFGFNQTRADFPKETTYSDLWKRAVAEHPDKSAIVFQNRRLTFAQTDAVAQTLGRLLRACGIGTDKLVGILSERSLEMLPAALAVIISGGAYLPIDPNYPDDRIQYMLADSQAQVLLCQRKLLPKAGDYSGTVIFIDDLDWLRGIPEGGAVDGALLVQNAERFPEVSLPVPGSWQKNTADDLIYMIYTSGSTGKPKGVMISHYNLVNICLWHREFHEVTPRDNTAFYSSFGFDASVWEIFPFLSAGVTVHVIADDIRLSPLAVNEYFNDHNITVANLPTQFCEQFMELCENRSLRRMVTGGDKLNAFKKMPYSLVNEYGPTEYTISATAYEVQENVTNIPIGKPLANTEIYIVDKYNRITPVGVPGEMCISGRQLARGYWQREELTAEKFVENPYYAELGAVQGENQDASEYRKMYRTGDRVRWLPDGNIEFLGRIDFQVKIRGYRIELGEIEQELYKNPAVKTASVLDIENGNGEKVLCAFVVCEDHTTSESDLKKRLLETLPVYMVPEHFVFLDALPLTANGKVDRRALPKPQFTSAESAVYIEPRNTVERQLAGVWQAVLNIERIGIDDNFFMLGGNSLRAGVMQARIQKELSVRVALPDIFRYPTIRLLSENVKFTPSEHYAGIGKAAAGSLCPLSSAQSSMFALAQLGDVGTAYNISIAYQVTGNISAARFEAAVRKMIERHEILRTVFIADDALALQKVLPPEEVVFNLAALPNIEGVDKLSDVANRFVRPFDLSVAPLFRIGLAEVADGSKVLLVDFNHIIMDGSALAVFWGELGEIYAGATLEPPRLQYRDYTVWSAAQKSVLERQEQYWLQQFQGEVPVLNLPYDFPRPDSQQFEGAREFFELPAELLGDLKRTAADCGVSLFMLMLAAYKTLLYRYTGQQDITVGSVVSGRTHADVQDMLGIFVNTLALRSYPDGQMPFRDYLRAVADSVMAGNDNQDYPFSMLAQKTAANRDVSRNPLFDVMLVLQNTDSVDPVIAGAEFKMLNLGSAYSQVDMTLELEEQNDGSLHGLVEYSTNLFKPGTIKRLVVHLANILKDIVVCPERKLSEIVMLSPEERDLLLNKYNDTAMLAYAENTVIERFENVAAEYADKTALVFGNRSYSYAALDELTNYIASEIAEFVKVEDIAAVMLERSDRIVIAELAALKSGAAFLPIDPQYPQERIEYMLADSSAPVLLTEAACLAKASSFSGKIVLLDDVIGADGSYCGSVTPVQLPQLEGNNLAYVIYTSGSTGKPKGVLLEHRNLMNLCAWVCQYHNISAADKTAAFSGFGFDASIWEMYPFLLCGAELHIVPEHMKLSLVELDEYFSRHDIAIVNLPTQICEQYIEQFPKSGLRTLVTGGDKLRQYNKRSYRLVNEYGPTEFTVSATAFSVDRQYDNIPIGKPLGNCYAYVLDKNNQLVPPGIPGELCLAGAQLARGYLNRPDLTAEKFVPNPFCNSEFQHLNPQTQTLAVDNQLARMYRTGDLVRWSEYGELEYLGRVDMQVKIRGYRIELGEIEQQLLKHPDVKDVVVYALDGSGGNKYLCAWYVAVNAVSPEQLAEHLAAELPEYMLPSAWVALDAIPLNANGKVDRRALPQPDQRSASAEYEAPQSLHEERVAAVWRDVLGCAEVGRNSNFFHLGGDSIKAIQAVSRLRRSGILSEVKWLLKKPVLSDFALTVTEAEEVSEIDLPVSGKVLLTPIQKWFFNQQLSDRNHWNQSALFRSQLALDPVLLEKALDKITERHDILRAVYEFDGGKVHQRNRSLDEGQRFALSQFSCNKTEKAGLREEIDAHCEKLHKAIDIETGPLLQCGLFNTPCGDYLALVVHHLVIDGLSWSIISEDFNEIYRSLLDNTLYKPSPRGCTFQKWAESINAYAHSAKLLGERAYWNTVDTTMVYRLPVLTDKPASDNAGDLRNCELVLDGKLTTALFRDSGAAYNTEAEELLLAGFAWAIQRWSGGHMPSTALTLETHGRQDIGLGVDVNRTLGWFTATYPLVLDCQEEIGEQIKAAKETVRAVPNHGIGYDVLHELAVADSNMPQRLPVEIEFNYLGENSVGEADERDIIVLEDIGAGKDVADSAVNDYRWFVSLSLQNGQLNIWLNYNKYLFEESEIARFLDEYRLALQEIAAHCAGRSREYTASDFGHGLASATLAAINDRYSGNVEDIYPLSPMQQGMLFVAASDRKAYFEQSEYVVNGKITQDSFTRHFEQLVEKYAAMRTAFYRDSAANIWQVVKRKADCGAALRWLDWRGLTDREAAAAISQQNGVERERGFDLENPPLLRLVLAQTGDNSWYVILSTHHIIVDGWSHGIIFQELFDNYLTQAGIDKTPAVPYRNYIDWLQAQDGSIAKKYWGDYLAGLDEQTLIPAQLSPGDRPAEFSEHSFNIDAEKTGKLKLIADACQVTMGTMLQALWAILLMRYNNRADVCFGYVDSGRRPEIEGVERIVGLMINTLPVRVQCDETTTFVKLLDNIQQQALASAQHNWMSLAEIQAQSYLRGALVGHLLAFQNMPDTDDGTSDYSIEEVDGYDRTNFDFGLIFVPGSEVKIGISYNVLMYSQEFIRQLCGHWQALTESVIANPESRVCALNILQPSERRMILQQSCGAKLNYDSSKTIVDLFYGCVQRYSDKIALGGEDGCFTYSQLGSRVDVLAMELLAAGLRSEQPAAVMVSRNGSIVTAALAIMRAGGVYLPIDVNYPESRIEYMITDSAAAVIITERKFADKAAAAACPVIYIDELVYPCEAGVQIDCALPQPEQLAYIIYTSGSTGTPKGVMIEHRSLMNITHWIWDYYGVDETDCMAAYSGFAFDASVWELLPFLMRGATLYVVPEAIRLSVEQLNDYFIKNSVTITDLPTQVCEHFIERIEHTSLRSLTTGGDKLRSFHARPYQLVNEYGPTEFTISATACRVTGASQNIPIGKPLANSVCYIIDNWGNLQPEGIAGELCLSGVQMARGYLGRPELTAEKFVPNLFADETWLGGCESVQCPNQQPLANYSFKRMYKTGDLVRRLPDGNIEFLGRLDQQVKIRGYRIELGEIEQQLLKCHGVSDAVVIAAADSRGDKFVAAYYVSEAKITAEALRSQLAQQLSEYMLPAVYINVDVIPLTPNGKIDKRALPQPEIQSGEEYVAPENAIEASLVKIWQELLDVENIGVTDNFLKLGGHSLKLVTLAGRISQEFSVELPFAEIFAHPTVRQLAMLIADRRHDTLGDMPIARVEDREYYPLSPAQNRMFILNNMEGIGSAYHILLAFIIDGELNRDRFGRAIEEMITRHESLRTTFELRNGQPAQIIHDRIKFKRTLREQTDDSPVAINRLIEDFSEEIRLDIAPLFKVELVRFPHNRHLFLFNVHHIVFDGVSTEIFMRDLFAIYSGKKIEQSTVRYRDYVMWQQQLLQLPRYEKMKQHWLTVFAGDLPVLNLPVDFPRPPLRSFEGGIHEVELPPQLCAQLKARAADANVTMFMLYLGAYYVLLSKYSGQDDIIIGTPSAGRSRQELETVVGMFVSTLPLRAQPEGAKPFVDFVREIATISMSAVDNQEYPLEEIIAQLGIKRDSSRNPLFDVMFSYGQFEPQEDVEGLQISGWDGSAAVSQFDLTLEISETENGATVAFEYCSKLFTAETIARMAGHFIRILEVAAENPETCISAINMLTTAERNQLICEFNSSKLSYPHNKTAVQMFCEQAALTPQKPALVYQDKSYSYQQLDELTNCLASLLLADGTEIENVVAVMVQRSEDIVICGLAALKAGAAFLPIDANYPDDRVKYLLEDSGAKILLTHDSLLAKSAGFYGTVHAVDSSTFKAELVQYSSKLPDVSLRPENLAYIIYTSGSTGRPKGVMLEHRNLLNLCAWVQHYHEILPEDRVATYSGFGFDASIWEMYPFLLYGNTVYVVPEELRLQPVELGKYLDANCITIINLPTQFCEQFMELSDNKSLKTLVTGGDKLRQFIRRDYRLVNEYGPTEYTVSATAFLVDKYYDNIPIGKPLANTELYVLDKYNALTPLGVPGELCIAGAQLARGYLNRPDLTTEKFVPNPFYVKELTSAHSAGGGYKNAAKSEFEKMYKTGDLVRWLPDGNIEFLGRIDSQVKIRGYRIELGEIEQQLLKIDFVQDAFVMDMVQGSSERFLVAYVVMRPEWEFSEAVLKKRLAEELPDYMIPAYFVELESIPVTPNGKIDKRALPQPEIAEREAYVAPSTDTEIAVAKVWKEVLQIDNIGISDNFFNLGGNSIKAISVMAKLNTRFAVTINDIFLHQTLRELAAAIKPAANNLVLALLKLRDELISSATQPEKAVAAEYQQQLDEYEQRIEAVDELKLDEKLVWRNILLTGATGFLGAHLLKNIADNCKAHINIVVRGANREAAAARVLEKLTWYFGVETAERLLQRVTVLCGSLEQPLLGLLAHEYKELQENVDCVFHTAANVRHFGVYEEFYSSNVQAVLELIKFAGDSIPLQHISTVSVAEGTIEGHNNLLFTEFDLDVGQKHDNVYLDTKLLSEKEIQAARTNGLIANIFRVGNIVVDSRTGIGQENIEENAFFAKLRAYVNIGAAPLGMAMEEFSYVDCLAQAIRLISLQPALANANYHLSNPNWVDMAELLSDSKLDLNVKALAAPEFIDQLIKYFDKPGFRMHIENILTHMDLLADGSAAATVEVDGRYSNAVLERLGFVWPEPDPADMRKMVVAALKERTKFLEAVPTLKGAGSAIETLARISEMRLYANKADVIWEGDTNDYFYLVLDGFASLSRRSAGGWSGTIGMLKRNDFFGLESVLGSANAGYTIEAELGEMLALAIPANRVHELLEENPKISLALLKSLQQRNEQFMRLLVNLS